MGGASHPSVKSIYFADLAVIAPPGANAPALTRANGSPVEKEAADTKRDTPTCSSLPIKGGEKKKGGGVCLESTNGCHPQE